MGLVLPNYTHATDAADFSPKQSLFLVILSLATYGLFLMIQTVRHRGHFTELGKEPAREGEPVEDDGHSVAYHALLLIAYLAPVVVLADKLAVPVDHAIANLGVPAALGGFLVALLVASPEALGAVRAALQNRMQRAINIVLGSALATISLTIPAVLLVSLYLHKPLLLGLEPEDTLMLLTTLLVCGLTFSSGRTNVLLGAVHLLLFLIYVMLIFDVHQPGAGAG
jgi:Ca2+:H+ antiporter